MNGQRFKRHVMLFGVVLAAFVLGGVSSAQTVAAYVRGTGDLWDTQGAAGTNEAILDTVFGAGNWTQYNFSDGGAIFAGGHQVLYLEGGDETTNELIAFLDTYRTNLEDFVNNGGTVLLNAAPNEGPSTFELAFGVYLNQGPFIDSVTASDPSHAIFQGPHVPVATDYTGNDFAHGYLSGPADLMPLIENTNDSSQVVLAELQRGAGWIVFGTMTTVNWQSPRTEAENLRANILAYLASQAQEGADVSARGPFGVGFDPAPLVRFAESAVEAIVNAIFDSPTDQSLVAGTIRSTLLSAMIPGYPDTPPDIFQRVDAVPLDTMGNPITLPRANLSEQLALQAAAGAGHPRVLGAPLLDVVVQSDPMTASVEAALVDTAGNAVASATVSSLGSTDPIQKNFLFDANALGHLIAPIVGDPNPTIPPIAGVTLWYAEEPGLWPVDVAAGVQTLSYTSVPLTEVDSGVWATSSPISLQQDAQVVYYFEVEFAEPLVLPELAALDHLLLPDPYNLQWVGRGALDRIDFVAGWFDPTTAVGDPTALDLAQRFAALVFRELVNGGDTGLASTFHTPLIEGTGFQATFDLTTLAGLSKGQYHLAMKELDAGGSRIADFPTVPLAANYDPMETVNLWSVVDTLFGNQLFPMDRAALVQGSLQDPAGNPIPDGRIVLTRQDPDGNVESIEVWSDVDGNFQTALLPGVYGVSAEATGYVPASTMNFEIPAPDAPLARLDVVLWPDTDVVSLLPISDQSMLEAETLTVPVDYGTILADSVELLVDTDPHVAVNVLDPFAFELTPDPGFFTPAGAPIPVHVDAFVAGSGSAPEVTLTGSLNPIDTVWADYLNGLDLTTDALVRVMYNRFGLLVPVGLAADGSFSFTISGPGSLYAGDFVWVGVYLENVLVGATTVQLTESDVDAQAASVDVPVGTIDLAPAASPRQVFSLEIQDVNSPPSYSETFLSFTVLAGTEAFLPIPVTDPDSTNFQVTVVSSPSLGEVRPPAEPIGLDELGVEYISPVPGSDLLSVEVFDVEGASAGILEIEIEVLPIPHVFGTGFDPAPIVQFAENAVDAIVEAIFDSPTDQSLVSGTIRSALLSGLIPGYPDQPPPRLFQRIAGATGDTMGNPVTLFRGSLSDQIAWQALVHGHPRVLGAPILEVFVDVDPVVADLEAVLVDDADTPLANGTVAPVGFEDPIEKNFLFDTNALGHLIAPIVGDPNPTIPPIAGVTLWYAEEPGLGPADVAAYAQTFSYISVPLTEVDSGVWATSSPIEFQQDAQVVYYFEVEFAEPLVLPELAALDHLLLPDPYNLQWVGRGALDRIDFVADWFDPATAVGDPTALDLAQRFASLVFRELVNDGDTGIASTFHTPVIEGAGFRVSFDRADLESLPNFHRFRVAIKGLDESGQPIVGFAPIPFFVSYEPTTTVNLWSVVDTLFGNQLFPMERAALVRGILVDPDGDPIPEGIVTFARSVEEGQVETVEVFVDPSTGEFQTALLPGIYGVTAEAPGYFAASSLQFEITAPFDPIPFLELTLWPEFSAGALVEIPDQVMPEGDVRDVFVEYLTPPPEDEVLVVHTPEPALNVSIEDQSVLLEPEPGFNTAELGPIPVVVDSVPEGAPSAPSLTIVGTVEPVDSLWEEVADSLTPALGEDVEVRVVYNRHHLHEGLILDPDFSFSLNLEDDVYAGDLIWFGVYSSSTLLGAATVEVDAESLTAGTLSVQVPLGVADLYPSFVPRRIFSVEVLDVLTPPEYDFDVLEDTFELNVGETVFVELPVLDPDSELFDIEILTDPAFGEITLPELPVEIEDLGFEYTATQGGLDTIQVEVFDDSGRSAGVLELVFDNAFGNGPPEAFDMEVVTPLNTPVEIELDAFDPEGEPLTFTFLEPTNGTLTGTGPIVTYTPDPGFLGTDLFFFAASDPSGQSSEFAEVEVTVTLPEAVIRNPARKVRRRIRVLEGAEPLVIDLRTPAPVFAVPDAPAAVVDVLAESEDEEVAFAEVVGGVLTIHFGEPGETEIVLFPDLDVEEPPEIRIRVSVLALEEVEGNEPPRFVPIPPQVIAEAEEATVELEAEDPEEDPLEFGLVSVTRVNPANPGDSELSVTVDPLTGETTLFMETLNGPLAKFRVVVSVSDGINDPIEGEFLVHVRNVNKKPELLVPEELTQSVGASFVVEVVAVDANADDVVELRVAVVGKNASIPAVQGAVRAFNTAEAEHVGLTWRKTFELEIPEELEGKVLRLRWTADDGFDSTSEVTLLRVGEGANLPPVVTPVDPIQVQEGESVEITFQAEDPEGEELEFEMEGLVPGTEFDPETQTFRWPNIGLDQAGRYIFVLTVRDASGAETHLPVEILVTDVNQPPVLVFGVVPEEEDEEELTGVLTEVRVAATARLDLVARAFDPDGDDVTLTVTGLPDWVRVKTNASRRRPKIGMRFEPPRDATDFSFTLLAVDSAGTETTATVNVVIEAEPNRPPELERLLPARVVAGESLDIPFRAEDPNDDPLTFLVDPLPEGATVTDNVFHWDVPREAAQPEPYLLTVTVDDGRGGQDTGELRIFVEVPPNRPPAVPERDPVALRIGEEVTLDLLTDVTDPDNDPLTLTLDPGTLPSAAFEFDPASGLLTLRAVPEALGVHAVVVTVSDGRENGTVSRPLLVTVELPEGGFGDQFVILTTFVDPAEATAVDIYTFGAVVWDPEGTFAGPVQLTVTDAEGNAFEAEMALKERTELGGEGVSGARILFTTELQLGVGEYTYQITAEGPEGPVEATGTGPVVRLAPVEVANLAPSGESGEIRFVFEIKNPNPGGLTDINVGFRPVDGDWQPATVFGQLEDLPSGIHEFVWDSGADVPTARGDEVEVRVQLPDGSFTAVALQVTNIPPGPPRLFPAAPSATQQVTLSGQSDTPGADILFLDGLGNLVGTAVVNADGTFEGTATLAEGENEVSAIARLGDHESLPSDPIRVIVDSQPPVLEVVSPERGGTAATLRPLIAIRADFGLSAPDLASAELRLNARPVPVTYDPEQGLFTAREELVNRRVYVATFSVAKQNGLSSLVAWAFTVDATQTDQTPPQVVEIQPSGTTQPTDVITALLQDAESPLVRDSIQVTVDGETVEHRFLPADAQSGSIRALLPEPLSEGEHQIEISVQDAAGNVGTGSAAVTIFGPLLVLDRLEIQTLFFNDQESPPLLGTTNAPTFTVQGTAQPNVQVLVYVDGSPQGVAVADEAGSWSRTVTFDAEGRHRIQLQARTPDGQVSSVVEFGEVLYDATSPVVALVAPVLDSTTGNLQPTFVGTARDVGSGVDPASLQLVVGEEEVSLTFDAALGQFRGTPTTAFISGQSVSVTVQVADFAGNTTTLTGTVTFDERVVDSSPPRLINPQIDGRRFVPGSPVALGKRSATVRFGAEDDLSGLAEVRASLDGVDLIPSIQDGIVTLFLEDLAEGEHQLVVQLVDQSGNASRPRSLLFRVDTTVAPVQLDVPALTNARSLVVRGSGVEPGAAVEVEVNGLLVSTRTEGDRFETAPARLQEGPNTVRAVVTDAAGNQETSEATVVLDTNPPRVAMVEPLANSTVAAGAHRIRIETLDENGIDPDSVVLAIDEIAVTPIVEGDQIVYEAPEPFAASTTEEPLLHFVRIQVADAAGNTTSLGVSFAVDGVPPTIAGFTPKDGEVVQTLQPLVTATVASPDRDGSTLEVLFGEEGGSLQDVTGDPNFTYVALAGQIQYSPALEDGKTYRVVVRIQDEAGNAAEASWAFSVDLAADDTVGPEITVLFPQEGEAVDETNLDILSFAIGDSSGIDPEAVYLFLNDPEGKNPVPLGRLVETGAATFVGGEGGGVVTLHGSKLLLPLVGARGGFSLDPLEMAALERNLTEGAASFDPLELGALERSLAEGGADVATSLERTLATSTGLLGVGTNTIGVQVGDQSGNVSFTTWSFDVTLDPPAAPVFDNVPSSTNQETITVSGHIPNLTTSNPLPIVVALQVNGVSAGTTQVTSVEGTFTFERVLLTAGENRLTATAQDAAGNLSERSEEAIITVDTVAPTVALGEVPAVATETTLTLVASIRDDQPAPLASVVLSVNGAEQSLSTSQGQQVVTATLAEGTNTLTLRATDAAGNTSSATATVLLSLAAPTTAPSSLSVEPALDGRGLVLRWSPDPNATTYRVYRSESALTTVEGLTPLASGLSETTFTDRSAPRGVRIYYAVLSESATGAITPTALSPLAGGVWVGADAATVALDDGTRLEIPSIGLFSSSLKTAVVDILIPESVPALENQIAGSEREIRAIPPSGVALDRFNQPATLVLPVPSEVSITDTSPVAYRLEGTEWVALETVRDAASRTVQVTLDRPAVITLAEVPSAAPWDLNGDGVVNLFDLVTVARSFGQTGTGLAADLTGDGVVNLFDLVTVARHFGEVVGAVATSAVNPAFDAPQVAVWARLIPGEGDKARVELTAQSPVPIAGWALTLDPIDGATIETVDAGPAVGSGAFVVQPKLQDGQLLTAAVRLDWEAVPSAASEGEAVLVTLHFSGRASAEAPFRIRQIQLVDTEGNLLRAEFQGFRIEPAVRYSNALLQNFPNPFNPETWIPFTLERPATVTIRIYDLRGQLIRTLHLGRLEAGAYVDRSKAVRWDGRNALGEPVASGTYLYEIEADSFRAIRRMVILK